MDDGDSIVVSAKVFACVEAIDCVPVSPLHKNVQNTTVSKNFEFYRRCAEMIAVKVPADGGDAVVGTQPKLLIPTHRTLRAKPARS